MNPVLESFATYPFVRLDEAKADARARGIELIDFGMGDPIEPTPEFIQRALADALPHVFDPAYLEHAATAWWIDWGDQGVRAGISLTSAAAGAGEQQASHGVQDGRRGIWFGVADTLPDRDVALAWLEGDEAELVLDIIATLDLTGIPAPVLPEG